MPRPCRHLCPAQHRPGCQTFARALARECDAERCAQAVGDNGVSAPTTPLLAQLESPTPPEPQRSVDRAGYRADASARTWPDFQYASAAERRAAADEIMQAMFERSVAEQEVSETLSHDARSPRL